MGFVGNDDTMGLFNRRDNRRQVERDKSSRVDDFDVDTFFVQLRGSLERNLDSVRGGNQSDVAAWPFHIGDAERNRLIGFWNFAARVQQPGMIDEDGRVIANIAVEVWPTIECDRVFTGEATRVRVVVSGAVVGWTAVLPECSFSPGKRPVSGQGFARG